MLSVAGVAIASFVSFYLSAFLMILTLCLRKDNCKFSFKKICFLKDEAKEILKLGLISGLQNAIFAIANSFVLIGVNMFDPVVVEGNSAALNADNIVYEAMGAFYVACSSFVSQNLGNKNIKRIRNSYLISLMYSMILGFIFSMIILLFSHQFLSLFTSSEEIIIEGEKRLKIMCFCYFLSGLMDTTIAASRGLRRTLIPTIIVVIGSCIFRIVWVYTVFSYYKTIESLYLLYAFSWVFTGLLELGYFIYVYNKEKRKINEDLVL